MTIMKVCEETREGGWIYDKYLYIVFKLLSESKLISPMFFIQKFFSWPDKREKEKQTLGSYFPA